MLVNITINGKQYTEDSSLTILRVARKHGIRIPTLCYLTLEESCLEHRPASCRVCLVEVEGRRNLLPACATQIAEGMVIKTNTRKVIEARRTVVELLLSNHSNDCVKCPKNGKCKLQNVAQELGIREIAYEGELSHENKYEESRGLLRNPSKCILCGKCVAVCKEVQGIEAISATNRGFYTQISDPSKCVSCGQCVQVCPTGALVQVDSTHLVEAALEDPSKVVIVNTAPATRVSLGEEFGLPYGTDVTKKMISSFRELGFDKVFDTNFTADLTIMEEATEFLNRFKKGENLPLITSCCPGWVKFIETQYPELLHLPSSCKSPMEMFGAVAKSYYAEKNGIDPKNIVLVSLMPCLAKKREADRPELENDGLKNVDIVITVKEYAEMLKRHGVKLLELEDGEFDPLIGDSTGAADIFANTGGVMEAVARTATKWLTGEVKNVDFEAVRGLSGTREATVKIGDVELRLCVVSGLGNARKVLDKVKSGEANYHAIEIMACPGGCVNGGGQPYHIGHRQIDVIKARQASIYNIDSKKELRVSCDNPEIKKIYDEYLGEPNSHKAHELLHTHYHDCSEE
ncbi:MAG: 4Fe-4S dicluster domain-containing protein [Erysipelotrichaceae bacterium]|nr:4Fe-4S dicluster domain-containing protein [Erysipelotrichaceae bacterium]